MNNMHSTKSIDDLASHLQGWAEDDHAEEACANVLIWGCGGYWLKRADFIDQCFKTIRNEPWFDLVAATRFVDAERVATSEQQHMLAFAISFVAPYTIRSLGDSLALLGPENATTVLEAIAHCMGWHDTGYQTTIRGDFKAPTPNTRVGQCG